MEVRVEESKRTTGKVLHGIYQGEYRHFRKLVAPSGLAYFHCEYPGCLNRITARYSSRKTSPDTGQTHGLCDIFFGYIFWKFGYLDIWIYGYF